MERRTFIGLTAGATLAASLEPLAHAFNPTRRMQFVPAKAELDQPGGQSRCVQITSEFMEDYTEGKPWTPFGRYAETYVARDGTTHLFGFQQADPFTGKPWNLERLSGQEDSITGWNRQQSLAVATDSGYFTKNQMPRLAMIPGDSDTLMVQRRGSLQMAPIAADGTVGALGPAIPKSEESWPALQGPLPAGARWMPEFLWGRPTPNQPAAGPHGFGLRDLANPSRMVPIEPVALMDQQNPNPGPFLPAQVIPLLGAGPDYYRCIIVTPYGDAYEMNFLLGADSKGNPVFKYFLQRFLGFVEGGYVYVQERTPGDVEVNLFYSGYVQTYRMSYDPNQGRSSSVWRYAERKELKFPSGRMAAGTRFEFLGSYNLDSQTTELFLLAHEPATKPDPATEIWSSLRKADGSWEDFGLHDDGCYEVKLLAGRQTGLLLMRLKKGYELSRRDRHGDWDTEHVRLPAEDGEMIETAGYRVGITVLDGKQGVPGVSLKLTTSTAAAAVVEGRHVTLRRGKALEAFTNGSGTAWVTVLMQHRLDFPVMYVDTPLCQDRLVINLNGNIENYMQNLQPDDLLKARDPRRCRQDDADGCNLDELGKGLDSARPALVTDPEKARKAAESISKLVKNAPRTETLRQTSSDGMLLQADLAAGWLAAGASLARYWPAPQGEVLREVGVAERRPRLIYVSGVAGHLIGRPVPGMDAYFGWGVDDAIDAVGDLANDAWNKTKDVAGKVADTVTQVVEVAIDVVKDGLSVALDFAVGALTYGLRVIVETIEQVMDLVSLVLDYAGMILGEAVGWLLEQLGFLFDWKAIRRTRDELKSTLRTVTPAVMTQLGDPRQGAARLKASLDSARRNMKSALLTLRSEPQDQNSLAQWTSGVPSLPDLFASGAEGLLAPATWMMEKVQGIMPRIGFGDPGITGLLDQLFEFGGKMLQAATALAPTLGDFEILIRQWVEDGKLFSSAVLDPLIDILLRRLDALFAALGDILISGGELLWLVMSNTDKIFDWLDSEIRIPFFSGFYKGLAKHVFSLLDVICLLAAIPVVVVPDLLHKIKSVVSRNEEPYSPRREWSDGLLAPVREAHLEPAALRLHTPLVGAVDLETVREAKLAFSIISCVTTPLSALGGALAPPDKSQKVIGISGGALNVIARVLTLLDQVPNAGAMLCYTYEHGDEAEQIAIPVLMGIGAAIIGGGVYYFREDLAAVMSYGFVALAAYHCAIIPFGNKTRQAALTCSMVQNFLSAFVASYKNISGKPLNGKPAAVVTLAQGLLQGGKVALLLT